MSNDPLERIANALDGGDSAAGTVNEKGYMNRIAKYVEENPGGGGGGSTGGGSMLVTISGEDATTKRFDKTAGEVINALNSGTIVRFVEFKETEDPSPEGHGLWTNYTLSTWSVYKEETPTGEEIAFGLIEFDYNANVTLRSFFCSALDQYPELNIA